MHRKLARDLSKVVAYVAPARAPASSQRVDFPSFVADLIEGVFEAFVNGSIQQMEAYAALLSDVAKSVDAFARDNVAAARARDHLVDRYPCLSVAKRSLTRRASRQQLLATMVLMGINRIVVTDGNISAAPAPRGFYARETAAMRRASTSRRCAIAASTTGAARAAALNLRPR